MSQDRSSLPVPAARRRRGLGVFVVATLMSLTACSSIGDLVTDLGRIGESSRSSAGVATNGQVERAYRVGPEDVLEISVWKEDGLKKEVLVRPDGGLSFPLAGDLHATGMSAEEVRDEIAKRLKKYIPDPVVTVAVLKAANYRVYVLGRVNKPGDFSAGRPINVMQALTIAGGLTPFASEDGIKILRNVDGKPVSIPFSYSLVRRGTDLEQNIVLKSGDVLLVP